MSSNTIILLAVYSPLQRGEVPLYSSLRRFPIISVTPQIAAPRRSRDIDQSTQRFHVGWFHVGWQGIGDQSDAVTQNAWFRCALCAAISGEISMLKRTGAESWGRFPVPRICRWESTCCWTITVFSSQVESPPTGFLVQISK